MIDFTEEQQMLVDTIEEIAEKEFEEKAFTWDNEVPWENLELLSDRGFLGLNIPEEYGGGGLSEIEVLLQIEAIGRICPDTAFSVYNQSMVGPRAVEMFGSEEAKEKYLPMITDAEGMIAICISEPHAGSDAAAMDTHIEEDDDGELYLNGEKIWVTDVPDSKAGVVWTYFPDEGLGTVIMDFDSPGVEINENYTNMAGGTQTHFFMEDVHIPEENVLVRGEQAFKEQLKALNWERCGNAIMSNATALCAFDRALEYAQEREQFDQPISEFQGIQWKLADMAKHIQAGRALAHQAVSDAQRRGGYPDRLQASMASLYCAEHSEEVVSEALQIFGATGYQQGHPLEYLYRLARGRRIGAGTDETQKNGIAHVLLNKGGLS